jgi:uncharacterized protein
MRNRIAILLATYRRHFFGLFLVLLVLMASGMRPIPFSGQLSGFRFQDNPFFAAEARIKQLFGSENLIYLQLVPSTTQTQEVVQGLRELENALEEQYPKVKITSIRQLTSFLRETEKNKPFPELLAQLAEYPIIQNLISKDQKSFLLLVNVADVEDFHLPGFNQVLGQDFPGLAAVQAMSLFHVEASIEQAIRHDLVTLSLAILLFFAGYLFLTFRSYGAILLALFLVLVPIFTALFFFSFFGITLNLITVLVIPVVLVISLADAIHLLTAYFDKDLNQPHPLPLSEILSRYLVPSFYSSATTAIAFFTFYFYNDAVYLQQFGLITGLTVLFEFFLTFLAAPFLLPFLSAGQPAPAAHLTVASGFLERHRRAFSFFFLALLPLALFLMPGLRFSSHPEMFFPVNSDIYHLHENFKENFYSQVRMDVLVEQKSASNPVSKAELERAVRQLSHQLQTHEEVVRVNAATDELPVEIIPGQPLKLTRLLGANNPYVSPDGKVYRLEVRFRHADAINPFFEKFERITQTFPAHIQLSASSPALLLAYVDSRIARSLLLSLLTSGFSIALMLLLLTRSWKLTIIGMIPNLVPLTFVVFIFYFFGLEINILTAITAIVAIGLLDDDTVHILYRLLHLKLPLGELALSILSTSVLLTGGFGLLVLSSFRPTQVFGTISAAVFALGVICELTLMPFLLSKVIQSINRQNKKVSA